MSAISVDVGNTGWTRAWICDHCGARSERVPSGTRSTTDDVSRPDILLEYDEEKFEGEGHPFKDWVAIERIHERVMGGPGLPRTHLCPACAGPLLDHLLERCAPPTDTTEEAKGVVELPYTARYSRASGALERLYGTEAMHNPPAQDEAAGNQMPSEDDGLPR